MFCLLPGAIKRMFNKGETIKIKLELWFFECLEEKEVIGIYSPVFP